MAGIYQTTLRKIARRRYNVFQGRVSLSVARKVGIALRIFMQTWVESRLLRHRSSAPDG
jgi:hypothetical protein